ncbi:hypothetical protein Tco_1076897, partial [Tanacetum coccineum]
IPQTQKPLVKDEEAPDVDVHLYRSMIGSLMYLTAFRTDIMFVVCACSRFQVTPKTSYLNAVERIFRYLKGKPKLCLWYPKVSSFDLETYSDSDYAGANLDGKSTTGEAEYVAAANCSDLLTKAFDVSWFNFLIVNIGMINQYVALVKGRQDDLLYSLYGMFYEQKNLDNGDSWTSAKSRIVNNISYIDAIVAGKPATISEESIRSDLLFDDDDGIDTLNNEAIFDTIYSKSTSWDPIPTNIATTVICLASNQKYNFSKLIFDGMLRHLDATKKFVMYPRFLQIFLRNQLKDVPVPMDHFLVPALTKKDEGEVSERPSESQPIPSLTHPSDDQPESQPDLSPRPSPSIPIPDSNLEGSGGNHEAQAEEIKNLKTQIKQLKKKAKPIINHHKAWFRAARLKKQQKKKDMEKSKKRRSVSKQGRKAVKSSKGTPSVQTHTNWDAMDIDDVVDYTLTQDEGKTDSKVEEPKTSSKTEELHLSGDTLVIEDKGSADKKGSTKSTDLQQSTVKPDEGTDKQNKGTGRTKVSTDSFVEGTIEIKDQVSGERVELKNVEDIERPRPTSTRSLLTLKPFPKIDPKAKGKGKIEEEDESDTESEDINEAVMKRWPERSKRNGKQKRRRKDKILAEKLQKEEREKFTIEERAKLIHDTIAAQRRFLAQQRSEVIRNKLPSRTQLRNQMMTYLKHVGGKKHSDLKTKFFEEIQVLYEKVKRSDENFIAIGSVEDERLIKDLNKKAVGIKNADSIKKESKEEENKDKEVDYKILDKKYPIIEWKSEYLGIKPQYDETKDLEEINLNVVIRRN